MDQIPHWISLFFQITQMQYEFLLTLATVGVILVVTWIVSRILGGFVSKAARRLSPHVTQQTRRVVTWLVWLIGILISLDQLGLELTILLVIVTLGAVILVITLRDALLNMASREIITIYSPFKIGDWVQVGKCFGRVVDITWMDTILMTLDNEMVYIPNSKITKSVVLNRTSPGETRISVSLTVDNALDFTEVETILLGIGDELREELAPDSKPEVRVTNVNDRTFELALLLKIHNPAKCALIASEVRKKAKMRLDEIRRRA